VKGLRDGAVDALEVQDPFKMGDLAVRALVDHLHGHPPQARIDTGVRVVTKGDLDDPAVNELLHPDLKKWLGE
jgi:ribose transport system substrate-binding protein